MSVRNKSSRQLMATVCKSARRKRAALDELERRFPTNRKLREDARRAREDDRKQRYLEVIEAALREDEVELTSNYLELVDEAEAPQANDHQTRPAEWRPLKVDPDTKPRDV